MDGSDDGGYESTFVLHEAAQNGEVETLKAFLQVSENDEEEFTSLISLINDRDDMECTPLHTSVIYGHFDCMKHLIDLGAKLSMKCAGSPLLHLILRLGALECHQEFVKKATIEILSNPSTLENIDVNDKDDVGNTPLHIIAQLDLHFCVPLFFQHGAKESLMKKNRFGNFPVHLAAKYHSTRVLAQLIQYDVTCANQCNSLGRTPGHLAALHNFPEGLTLLQQNGWDAAIRDKQSKTALELAQACQFEACVAVCQGESVNKDKSDEKPCTMLVYHPEFLEHLPNARIVRGGPDLPPENPERIDTLVKEGMGVLHSREFRIGNKTQWDYDVPLADMADIVRVHDYRYVKKICEISQNAGLKEDGVMSLDSDTALSKFSYDAARRAAGATCKAIDHVISGRSRNAFAVVRPPGHHAGPVGKVTCCNDPEGSHGFCLFNNIAVGAAYARCVYRQATENTPQISRVAIVDFDVHHGNGTEDIILHLRPETQNVPFETPYGRGSMEVDKYKPWLNESDMDNVFFASVHGYGRKDPAEEFDPEMQAYWFYPGSGETCGPTHTCHAPPTNRADANDPLIVNVGLPYVKGTAGSRKQWRDAFRDKVLPQLTEFNPDLILVSAGFDGHRRELVNWGYAAVIETEYEWLTNHLVRVANKCCDGRIVSVLEGGYNFYGRLVSPFARSVAAHVRGLTSESLETWTETDVEWERQHEREIMEEIERKKKQKEAEKEITAKDDEYKKHELPVDSLESESRSKRRRSNVDYVALSVELDQEKH